MRAPSIPFLALIPFIDADMVRVAPRADVFVQRLSDLNRPHTRIQVFDASIL